MLHGGTLRMANMACAKTERKRSNKCSCIHSHSSDANNVTCFSLLSSIRLHHHTQSHTHTHVLILDLLR